MTTLAEEREEQRRWRLRPERAALAEALASQLEREFAPPETHAADQGRQLARLATFAAAEAPYWSRRFRELRLDPRSLADLAALEALPVLSKGDLLRNAEGLRAQRLPPRERAHSWTSSSGTTGRSARVLHSVSSSFMFTLLRARSVRWFRLDPSATLASIRLASQHPQAREEGSLRDGETRRRDRWRHTGDLFETGPQICFNVTNPVERQLAWLAAERPHYLEAYSETLEHLVFACEGVWPAPSVRKLQALSEQLTPSMRRRIEATTGAPIEQGYGLNEIGLVAVRCEAGRYHVHTEHCVVEIVDDAGKRCAPGATGRVVVSTLVNTAMPLFRYDTGDLAVAASAGCACGRTLPAFGDLAGRYSRIAYLPEGTLGHVGVLREALESAPLEVVRQLRQFQVHQFSDGSFELRVLSVGAMPAEFERAIRAAWRSASGDAHALRIARVDAIPRSPGGKFQDFTSDFLPQPDRESS